MRITDAEYRDYQRLKREEQAGHLLTLNTMRLIVKECDYDPEKVGNHFLEVYARRRHEQRQNYYE